MDAQQRSDPGTGTRRLQVRIRHRLRAGLQDAARARRRGRPADFRAQGRTRVDAQAPPQGAPDLRGEADAPVGRRPLRARGDAEPDLFLRQAAGADGALLGRRSGEHQGDLRAAGDSRGRAEDPCRGRSPVRLGDGLPLAEGGVGGEGRDLRFDRGRAQEPPRAVPQALRYGDSGRRQQVRGAQLGGVVGRVLRVHPAGRSAGDAAAGVLPREPGAAWDSSSGR